MGKSLSLQEFIDKSNEMHHFKYDYSKTDYKNSRVKVCIICPEHGEFWQIPSSHLNGCGCPKCGINHQKNKGNDIQFDPEKVLTNVKIAPWNARNL